MNAPIFLRTARTLSRLATPDDAAVMLDYFRDAGQRYDPPLPEGLLTLDHWKKHSQQLLEEHARGTAVKVFVFTPDESMIIGTIGLSRITRGVRQDCSLSYTIRESHEGKGLMREAVGAAICHAFDGLKLHRIEACHAPDNHRSRALLERLGFVLVGTIPGFLRSASGWRDTVLHSLLEPAMRGTELAL